MSKILLVEDDEDLAESLLDYLTENHFQVEVVDNGADARDRLKFYQYQLVIIDWGLPDVTGAEVVKEYRAKGGETPILMLTARGEIQFKEAGFDAGADDYLTKPFDPRELIARLRSLIRRSTTRSSNIISAGGLELNTSEFRLTKNGCEVKLGPKEFELLEFLMRHPNQVYSPEGLMNHVWASDSETAPATVRVHVTNLRSKIDTPGIPSLIETVHRKGYRFSPPS